MLNQFKKFLLLLPQRSVKSFNALLVASSWLGLVISGCAPSNSANTNTTAQNVSNQTQEKTSLIRLGYQKGGVVPIARQRGELEKRLAAQNIKAEWAGPFDSNAMVIGLTTILAIVVQMSTSTLCAGCGRVILPSTMRANSTG
ncbi:hypothetical protein [Nostoc sp.]|uniref:hypothetical protein n=1 Tax=Nostoc sp. TaxID=1180 RepID=UPI002FFBCAEF